jgi:hypothetical protein
VSVLQGPLVAVAVLGVLVWLGMGVSVGTMLQRAEVPPLRAYAASLLLWPLLVRRMRQLRRPEEHDAPGDAGPGPE